MAKAKFPTIPPGSLIKIEISGYFYSQLTHMLLTLSVGNEQQFKKALERLKSNDPAESDYEFNIQTLVTLIYEIEKKAKEQNVLVEQEIEIDKD